MDDVEKLAREALAGAVGCWTDDYSLRVGLSRSGMPSERALTAIKSAILAERERCTIAVEQAIGIGPFPDYIELEINGALETVLGKIRSAPPTP